MRVTHISAATYGALAETITSVQTIMLNGRYPISIGHHDHYPGAQVMIAHIQDRFIVVELDPETDPDPEWVKRAFTINPDALQ